VGKYILETRRTSLVRDWEGRGEGDDEVVRDASAMGEEDDYEEDQGRVEFDSQDEEECEDLFAGVWTQGLARKRRRGRVGYGGRGRVSGEQ